MGTTETTNTGEPVTDTTDNSTTPATDTNMQPEIPPDDEVQDIDPVQAAMAEVERAMQEANDSVANAVAAVSKQMYPENSDN